MHCAGTRATRRGTVVHQSVQVPTVLVRRPRHAPRGAAVDPREAVCRSGWVRPSVGAGKKPWARAAWTVPERTRNDMLQATDRLSDSGTPSVGHKLD